MNTNKENENKPSTIQDAVSKSNSIQIETLAAKVFTLANELAIAGYGNAAVKLHTVHNGMITDGHFYSC